MLTIGLGKHEGCSRLHKEGFQRFAELIPKAAGLVLETVNVPFGLAIVENAYDETFLIEAVPKEKILTREMELLILAKSKMPKIYVKDIDVLVIEQIGKNISGAGMDPTIVGRTTQGILEGYEGPAIGRIIVLDVSEASHGNAIGLGLADFTIENLLSRIDYTATFANAIASGNPESGRMPIAMESCDDALHAALACCPKADIAKPRIVRIRNTLNLQDIWISEAYLPEIAGEPFLELL
jgi:hypothetical protein